MNEYTVGEVARLARVSVRTLHTDNHLRRQHRLLRDRIARDQELLGALEKEMEARQMGISTPATTTAS